MTSTPAKQVALAAASVAALAVGYSPLVADFAVRLWQRPFYHHTPFLLLGAVVLYVARRDEPGQGSASANGWLAALMLVGSAPLLLAGSYIPSPMLAVASLWLLLGVWGLRAARLSGARFPWGPWALLWLVIPPPLGLDRALMRYLQLLSSQLSSYVLDMLGLNHLMDGNTLVFVDKPLFVDEACSGIVSVVSIIATAALYGVWRRRSASHTLGLMAVSAAWAALLNVVRIVAIALAWAWVGLDWAEGPSHTALGLGIFTLSLGVLVANDWFLKAVFAAIEPRWREQTAEPLNFGRRLVTGWDLLATYDFEPEAVTRSRRRPARAGSAAASLGWLPTAVVAAIGVAQFSMRPEVRDEGILVDPLRIVEALQAEGALPSELEGLSLEAVAHEVRTQASDFGAHSVKFQYRDPAGVKWFVSCDLPYDHGWHSLSVCYVGIGWEVTEKKREAAPKSDSASAYDYIQLSMKKPDGSLSLVTYTAMGPRGEPREAPRRDFMGRIRAAMKRKEKFAVRSQTVQVQVLVGDGVVLSDTKKQRAERVLKQVRPHVARVLRSLADDYEATVDSPLNASTSSSG